MPTHKQEYFALVRPHTMRHYRRDAQRRIARYRREEPIVEVMRDYEVIRVRRDTCRLHRLDIEQLEVRRCHDQKHLNRRLSVRPGHSLETVETHSFTKPLQSRHRTIGPPTARLLKSHPRHSRRTIILYPPTTICRLHSSRSSRRLRNHSNQPRSPTA